MFRRLDIARRLDWYTHRMRDQVILDVFPGSLACAKAIPEFTMQQVRTPGTSLNQADVVPGLPSRHLFCFPLQPPSSSSVIVSAVSTYFSTQHSAPLLKAEGPRLTQAARKPHQDIWQDIAQGTVPIQAHDPPSSRTLQPFAGIEQNGRNHAGFNVPLAAGT